VSAIVSTILIIRPGAIGDSLLAFPILSALRRQFINTTRNAGSHIIYVSNAAVLPLALASGLADEVSDYGDPHWGRLFSASGIANLGELFQPGSVDLAICWLRDPDGFVERNLRGAGVKQVIVAPGRPPEGQRIHIVEYLAATLRLETGCIPRVGVDVSRPGAGWGMRDTVAIHPGSGSQRKCWPAERFAEVVKRLWQQGRPVLLLGGPADGRRLQEIKCLLPPAPALDLLTVLENAPLLEVAWHLGNCACYLGNDSGITHLAALLGLHTIALFGPTDPCVWKPVGPHVDVIWQAELEQIEVDAVIHALRCVT
jgi:heptosyltransferase-3